MKMNMFNKKRSNQQGLVSIIVTFIIIIMISLIVLGFSRLVRRSQTQTIDKQLNTQALYAAETGINDALKALSDGSAAQGTYNTACDQFINITNGRLTDLTKKRTIDAASSVSYSCLLVDSTPKMLSYQNILPGHSEVVPINSLTVINSVELSWENPGNSTSEETCSSFPAFPASWACKHPVLRIDVIPQSFITNRANLINNTATFFAYPTIGGETGNYTLAKGDAQGQIVQAKCLASNATRRCILQITNIPGAAYLRISPIYQTATVDVTANNGAAQLTGAQTVIDSTGKARDVLKRIRIYSPQVNVAESPFYALESGVTLCKRLIIVPNPPGPPSAKTNEDSAINPRCQIE